MLDGAGIEPMTTPAFAPVTPGAAPATPAAPVVDTPPVASPGKPGKPQVLAYLDAMDDKIRTAIVNEIIRDDPKLAAELLEALRVRGTFAAVAQGNP
ncbi:MAG: hypothetical protein IPI84_12500 [Holophagaceae bacterium]|nr:hypothetical protein [Holophagaceae bacterium]